MTYVDFSECSKTKLVKMITKVPKVHFKKKKVYTADEVDTIRGMNVARRERTVNKDKFYYLMLIERLDEAVSVFENKDPIKVRELKERINNLKKII